MGAGKSKYVSLNSNNPNQDYGGNFSLTQEEIEALNVYAGMSYEPINRYIRKGELDPILFRLKSANISNEEDLKNTISLIDSAISKNNGAVPNNLYRATSTSFIGSQSSLLNDLIMQGNISEINKLIKGVKATDKGFMSTSTNLNIRAIGAFFPFDRAGVVFKIKTGKHTKGIYISEDKFQWVMPNESEFLVARNSTIKLNKVIGGVKTYTDELGDITRYIEIECTLE